jgi:hypothetical protein
MMRNYMINLMGFRISARWLLRILAAVIFGVPLVAMQLPDFSADTVNTTNGKVSRGRIYHTANKDRVDTTTHLPAMMGQPARDRETHMITDREQKLIYVVEPQKKLILVNYALQIVSDDRLDHSPDRSCVELAKVSGSMVAMKGASNCKQLGSESVNGRAAAIWEVHVGMGAIQLGTWKVWVDSQWSMAIKWQTADGTTGELENVQFGPQSASLFVLPADYRRQDLPH